MFFWRTVLAGILLLPTSAIVGEQLQRRIAVTGAADVRVQPDYVVLSMGVESKSPTLAEAKQDNDTRIERVLSFIKDSGVPVKDIQTDYLSIVPVPKTYETKVTDYFRVQRSITVTVRELQSFDAVLNGSVERGITNVHGIDFRTSELKRHREKARDLAILAALEKAEKLATGLGASVGLPLSIDDSSWGGVSSWSPNSWGQRDRGSSSQVSYTPGGSADEPAGPVALGQILVSATVRVSFALK